MADLVEYAEAELKRAGLLDKDSDYDGMLGEAALEIIALFAEQGHSGNSAFMLIDIVTRLMKYEPLTPLTSDPEEWMKIEEDVAGDNHTWQSRRDPAVFSRDGGQTWYHLDDPSKNNGDTWKKTDWMPYSVGDERIKPGHRARVKPDAYTKGSAAEINGREGSFAGARNGLVFIQYDDDHDTAGAPHDPDKIEVEAIS